MNLSFEIILDYQHERNYLMEHVYYELRDLCQKIKHHDKDLYVKIIMTRYNE